jgi:hypothetical protein
LSLTESESVRGSNFREDVNATGSINAGDGAQIKANVGTALRLDP